MAGPRVIHPTLTGPSVVKEICLGFVVAFSIAGSWKMHQWNDQRKVKTFYELLDKGEISITAEEE